MAPVMMHLDGEAQTHWPAERCILSIMVSSKGENQISVSTEVKQVSNKLQDLFRRLSPKTEEGLPLATAPITIFSMTGLRTSVTTSNNSDGQPQPPLHHASTSFEVTFRDFDQLAHVANTLFTTPLVAIHGTTWSLTDATRARAETETRQATLRDAIKKAEEYADVLGLRAVVTEITDHGGRSRGRTMQTARKTGWEPRREASDSLLIEPEEVEIYHSLAVKFVAE